MLTQRFIIKLPDPINLGSWVMVNQFASKKEAEQWLYDTYGINFSGSDVFIVENPNLEEEQEYDDISENELPTLEIPIHPADDCYREEF